MSERSHTTPGVLLVDEEHARARVRGVLQARAADQVRVVGEATTGPEAISAIFTLLPDIVFLDVETPGVGGFDVMRAVGPERMPVTVLVTSCDHYALEAFHANALDYLLKPFTDERLLSAVRKAVTMARGARSEGRAVAASPFSPRYRSSFAVPRGSVYTLVQVEDVEWIEACENYVRLHLRVPAARGGAAATLLVRESITRIHGSLDPEHFLRVHRSAVVNRRAVVRIAYLSKHVYEIHLAGGARVMSSRGYADQVRSVLA